MFLFSCSAMSASLWPHGLQHTRLPCPSLFLSFSLFHSSLFLSWHSSEGSRTSALAPFSPWTHSRLELLLSHGFRFLLLMPPPGRALFGPLPKPQNPLTNAIHSPGAWRSSWLPLAGREVPASLAVLNGLTLSRISSPLTLTTQDLFLPMTVWLRMAHQRMYHLHNFNPF